MGGSSSKSNSAPAPPFFKEPWREIYWMSYTTREKYQPLQYVKDYKPFTECQQLRILMCGPTGAGKSSFVNSIQNVLRGRMVIAALADTGFTYCFTKEYQSFKIQRRGPDDYYPFIFNDIMGIGETGGVLVDDIKLAFEGHVKDGYRFNPESKLSEDDRFYNTSPTENDKVHVLVCVVPANTFASIPDEVKRKLREVRLAASRLGIPQVAILTKVDLACPEVNKDLKNIYWSKLIKQRMEEFSAEAGIPMNCIFPVKNYHNEIDHNSDVDSLILSAFKHIINFGDDFINRKLQNK